MKYYIVEYADLKTIEQLNDKIEKEINMMLSVGYTFKMAQTIQTGEPDIVAYTFEPKEEVLILKEKEDGKTGRSKKTKRSSTKRSAK